MLETASILESAFRVSNPSLKTATPNRRINEADYDGQPTNVDFEESGFQASCVRMTRTQDQLRTIIGLNGWHKIIG